METVRPTLQPNVLFVLLHTDDGHTGLGEAFIGARAVEAYLHETAAPILLAAPDIGPERAAKLLAPYAGYQGGGVEVRGNGAVDLALWDLLGKRAGLPLAALLGGPVRDSVPVYNTCAGPGYIRTSTRQESANWGLPGASRDSPDAVPDAAHRYEDLDAFLTRPAQLARELWDSGLRGMKVWPFDRAAEETGGNEITRAGLRSGLRVLERIREEVGADMRLMIELHGLWNRPAATDILRAVQEFAPFWVEDPLRPDAVDAVVRLAEDTGAPIATGETLVGRRGFAELLRRGAVQFATVDVQWTGGLTEARRVAGLADLYGVPVAPHDCTGPATLAACVHLVCSQPNGVIQETVRAFLATWYPELVTGLPEVRDGRIVAPEAPGHGVALRPELLRAGAAATRAVSRA
ncbi:mandelate racemase/muconate lactonizing enzyme family protein [Streptomyces sp. 3MP-14]|uniref:Mandelate racemase/muconate lactonizing enzyme family protein n=1 Tax=Streptomyces mimosae TaxID=2586635 RepID=A0A5N6A9U0_9ACTN|nr:mandelate racemase/muconate lactonizing enzyme family protein [Streptomyces mimosae]KAB8175632.1 mandelate racemase/muconate lactonizing enzyme family protein [Streptomyces sp. 3MP-14]